MKAIFTGGGTGGHIYPALAVAQRFRDISNIEIRYIGSKIGMEKKIIEDAGFLFSGIETDGFRSKNPIDNFKVLLKLREATKVVKEILKNDKPEFVFATGGYVSAPVVLAAKNLKIPIFLHEQNSIPGLTNKISSRFAKLVFTTFPGSEKHFPTKIKTVYSGLPVRKEFSNINIKEAYQKFNFNEDKRTLLITGGSGGSFFLNKAVLSLYEFAQNEDIQIIHVTGERDYPIIREKIAKMSYISENIHLYPYLSNMYDALAIADICISRAGAAFLSEMLFMGKTGVVIPFPYAANNHQLENAKDLSEKKAIIMIEEKEIQRDSVILKEIILDLLKNEEKIEKMKKTSSQLGIKNTLDIIVNNILKEIGVNFE